MSSKVTEASKKRMAEREHFGVLSDPYIDVINLDTGLPRVSITIEGRPEAAAFAEDLIYAMNIFITGHYDERLKIVKRRTA